MSIHDVNQALLNVLGLGNERDITKVTLVMRPGELPELKLRRAILSADGISIDRVVEWRKAERVVEKKEEPPAFDLDAACASATAFLNNLARSKFERLQDDIKDSFHGLRSKTFKAFVNMSMQNSVAFSVAKLNAALAPYGELRLPTGGQITRLGGSWPSLAPFGVSPVGGLSQSFGAVAVEVDEAVKKLGWRPIK